ncbi:MAG: hypothetical protein HYV20_05630 [Gemmatimonadetes bacterium]|nr:hypothetical protein [Gemmatimonadota bacterium]
MTKPVLSLVALLAAAGGTASAQLIGIKTVPVAQADQFAIFPSRNLGMGAVSIAVADPLLDAFVNPAKGSRMGAPYLYGSPGLYSVSSDAGGGRTLPLAATARAGTWFGGLALALQEVDAARTNNPPVILANDVVPPQITLDEGSHGNQYAFAMVGRTVPAARLSLGGSVFLAGLHAIDGVDLLYAGSQGVAQAGNAVDARVGVLKEWDGDRSLEALVLYSRLRMTHDVTFLDWFWDPATQRNRQQARMDQNRDYSDIWGLHLEYERPLSVAGWRIGWLATANRMSHPKLPNYEIRSVQVIPRDPGTSYAFNAGLGIARTHGPATFGIDVIYEPIWSHTWADAEGPTATRTGGTIPASGMTIENHFRFSNALVRMGVTRDLGQTADFQLGLVVRSIQYRLNQDDHGQVASRSLREHWVEWTPTWGFGLRFPEVEIRYQGRVANGTGRPGVVPEPRGGFELADATARVASNILVAPTGPLTLGEVKVVTHQISLSVPIR